MRLEKIEYNFNIFKPHDYKIIYYMLYALLYIWRVTRREIIIFLYAGLRKYNHV